MELKHQLKACLLDNQVLKSAKTKFETERQAILEREKAMHQGHEQMGREKEDAGLRALTLDEEVHKLKTKVEQLPAARVQLPFQNPAKRSVPRRRQPSPFARRESSYQVTEFS